MFWRYLRQFPKLFIAFVVIAASLTVFYIWRANRAAHDAFYRARPEIVEETKAKVALIESKIGQLILVDKALYDLDSGALIVQDWLKDGVPLKLFWKPDTKQLLAQYKAGFVRYGIDGVEDARLVPRYPLVFSDNYKWVLFARDKDIWKADVDWQGFKLINERKVTSVEQFDERFFAESVLFGTDKTLIVREKGRPLRINLDTGEVKPIRLQPGELAKRLSPDSKSIVGLENGQFYCYDVDSDEAKTNQVGRGAINDYQWLGNDKCVAIAASKTVIQYDRLNNALTVVLALPSQCNKIGEPSPDGRFVFCYSFRGAFLVDLEKKSATPVTGGAGVCWLNKDTFAFSREVPDSNLRGTWLQTVGEGERRISDEPYLVNKGGESVQFLKTTNEAVFATQHGLSKMRTDGTGVTEAVTLNRVPERVLGIGEWNQ